MCVSFLRSFPAFAVGFTSFDTYVIHKLVTSHYAFIDATDTVVAAHGVRTERSKERPQDVENMRLSGDTLPQFGNVMYAPFVLEEREGVFSMQGRAEMRLHVSCLPSPPGWESSWSFPSLLSLCTGQAEEPDLHAKPPKFMTVVVSNLLEHVGELGTAMNKLLPFLHENGTLAIHLQVLPSEKVLDRGAAMAKMMQRGASLGMALNYDKQNALTAVRQVMLDGLHRIPVDQSEPAFSYSGKPIFVHDIVFIELKERGIISLRSMLMTFRSRFIDIPIARQRQYDSNVPESQYLMDVLEKLILRPSSSCGF